MIINKEILIKAIKDRLQDEACYGEEPCKFRDIDDVHDTALFTKLGVEDYDMMYYEMLALLNTDGEEIIDELNDYIDEEFQTYYGDPAFSSAQDYWGYILG